MKKIKNILKESATLPLFLQNMETKPQQEVRIEKITNRYFSCKVLITVLFLFLFSKTYALSDRFLNYCKHTNHAELNIMDDKLQQAVTCYDSAFSLYSKPLAKDIHNAIVCAKKTGDEQKIKKYLDLMITTKSMNPKYYNYERLLKYLSKKEKESIKKKYTDKIKSDAYLFVQKTIKKDQLSHSGKLFISGVDYITFKEYQNYFGNSFPGEDMMIPFPCAARIDGILYTHWFQGHFDVVSMTEKLVEDLQYLNLHYAFQYEETKGTNFDKSKYGLVIMLNINGKITPIKRSAEEIEAINKNRMQIGLDSYEEYVRKVEFFKKHTEFCYCTAYYVVYFT